VLILIYIYYSFVVGFFSPESDGSNQTNPSPLRRTVSTFVLRKGLGFMVRLMAEPPLTHFP